MPQNFLALLQLLADDVAEFIIVGGVAAFLHGGKRVTYDIDIVPSLDSQTWPSLIDTIWDAGGRPRIPETREAIKDIDNVKRWMNEKGMMALTFKSPNGVIEIDLLVKESHRFEELFTRAKSIRLDDRTYHVVSINDLIEMKRQAGRPQDLLDITELEVIQRSLETS